VPAWQVRRCGVAAERRLPSPKAAFFVMKRAVPIGAAFLFAPFEGTGGSIDELRKVMPCLESKSAQVDPPGHSAHPTA
jgi:hypothetical protein